MNKKINKDVGYRVDDTLYQKPIQIISFDSLSLILLLDVRIKSFLKICALMRVRCQKPSINRNIIFELNARNEPKLYPSVLYN